MRILIYEFVTGGGWFAAHDEPPPASLLAEGSAMLGAVVADFCAVAGTTVDVLLDRQFAELTFGLATHHVVDNPRAEPAMFASLAAAADWTLVIAPEFDGHLLARCRAVENATGQLLGPSSRVVALAADKHATAEYLAARGVAVPRGVALAPGERLAEDFPYPAVLKPRDGAGSQGMQLVRAANDVLVAERSMRLEAFCPGTAASVACLCGPRGNVPLVPCRQHLSDDGTFTYQGGSLPLPAALAERAANLAERAVAALPGPLGYIGVDLVLGDDSTGAGDVVIEINPRLTTSYVGLRALARPNLAAAMLALAEGRQFELSWYAGPIQFEATGHVHDARSPAQSNWQTA
ncbi:MAG: ATP-grasp domain-containing protein [Pirellulales bacterium]